jgi:hypothetical protein
MLAGIACLSAGDGADYEKRFFAGGDGLGEWSVGGFVGDVFFAGEEAQEGAALFRGVVADGALQHWVLGFERIEDGALRDGGWNFEQDVARDFCERAEVRGEDYVDHGLDISSGFLDSFCCLRKSFIAETLRSDAESAEISGSLAISCCSRPRAFNRKGR